MNVYVVDMQILERAGLEGSGGSVGGGWAVADVDAAAREGGCTHRI